MTVDFRKFMYEYAIGPGMITKYAHLGKYLHTSIVKTQPLFKGNLTFFGAAQLQ